MNDDPSATNAPAASARPAAPAVPSPSTAPDSAAHPETATPRPGGADSRRPTDSRPRPPRRPWRPAVSVVAFVIALALGAVAHVGSVAWMAPALAVPMVLLAIGWVPLMRLPSPRGTTIVQLIAVVLLLAPAALSPRTTLERLPAFVALSMIASFVHQLVRRDARPRLVESVSAVVAGVASLIAISVKK